MSSLDAKVTALINASEVSTADSVPDKGAGAPPSGSASGAESAAGAPASVAGGSPVAPGASAAPTLADVMREKLAKTREARQAQRNELRARDQYTHAARAAEQAAAEAKADREAAAAERSRWENLRSGNILETIKAAGKDPAKVFADMQREAIEAGTPEAQLRRMREEMDRQLTETVEPLKKTIEQLTREREEARAHGAESAFASDFGKGVADPAYEELRIEYPDDRLLAHAKNLRDNPEFFFQVAKQHGVRLTDPSQGFNMRDILNVLKSVQDAHVAGSQQRRAARTATPQSETAPQAASPTVNGTAERRNAGATTIGNDLATARAADGKFIPKGTTAAQRLRERTRRFTGSGE